MANVILNIRVTDAETDAPVDLLDDGSRPSVLILPIGTPVPAASFVEGAVKALLAVPANGPIPPDAPIDKSVTGSPEFATYDLQMPLEPRIYRVDPQGLSLDLGPKTPPLGGWYVALIPPATDTWEFEPTLVFVTQAQDLTITAFRRDLTPLAKEILEKRAAFKPQFELLKQQWSGESAVVWDMVHAFVENTLPPKDERLAAYWINDLSWAVTDVAIPAREFDLLVERYTRVQAILAAVPWPDLVYFQRCAYGIPITIGKDGKPLTIANWRLCVPTFSDYFPRDDRQIMQDLGFLWMANLAPIFECIVKKVIEKQKEAQKTAKFWKYVSLLVPIFILPSPALVVSAVSDLIAYQFLQNVNPLLLQGLQVAEGLVLSLVTGGTTVPGLDGLGGKAFDGMLSLTQQFLEAEGLQALQEAAKDAESLQAFVNGMTGIDQIPPSLAPFITWCLRVSILDVVMAALIGALTNQPTDPQLTITYPLLESAQAAGVPVPASLVDLVQGNNPDFPAQAPSGPSAAVVVAASGGVLTAVLGVLYFLRVI